jgi:hypothetical protein
MINLIMYYKIQWWISTNKEQERCDASPFDVVADFWISYEKIARIILDVGGLCCAPSMANVKFVHIVHATAMCSKDSSK